MTDESRDENAGSTRAGVILAGGRSTRFGDADKAFADLAGVPMVRRVAERVGSVTDELVVNCRADQRRRMDDEVAEWPQPVTVAVDQEPDQGPMAGIATGLRATNAEYAAVVACDMPFVDPDFVDFLFERAASADAAVPRRTDGWYQTTQAVYRTDSMLEACDSALERGEGKILAPLETLEYAVVDDETVTRHASTETFENVNTRAEFEAATEPIRDEEDSS